MMDEAIEVFPTSSTLSPGERWDHILARWRWHRSEHRVRPGLYSVGQPQPDSPVLVSANYTLSFDILRAALNGLDAYILVLNTYGINVWCAAGKGTFGTEELAERIEISELARVVDHRRIILPQLGAPGVCAHEVKRLTGFKVEYGPVRARDLPAYLKTREATPEMRRVRFGLADRLVLVPVEAIGVAWPTLLVAAGAYLLGGWPNALMVLGGVATGVVLFPVLMPWLPSKDYSTKGFFLGGLYALAVVLVGTLRADAPLAARIVGSVSHFLIWPAVVSFIALNFTGSTPYPSRTGVRREIYRYVRVMAVMFGLGLILNILAGFLRR